MTQRSRIERLEAMAPTPQLITPEQCICVPADEQPIFGTKEELNEVLAVRCPVHGERLRR